MVMTIHAGDCTTDCPICVANCDCSTCKAKCDCDNLDQDVEGYTCYKCYERG